MRFAVCLGLHPPRPSQAAYGVGKMSYQLVTADPIPVNQVLGALTWHVLMNLIQYISSRVANYAFASSKDGEAVCCLGTFRQPASQPASQPAIPIKSIGFKRAFHQGVGPVDNFIHAVIVSVHRSTNPTRGNMSITPCVHLPLHGSFRSLVR